MMSDVLLWPKLVNPALTSPVFQLLRFINTAAIIFHEHAIIQKQCGNKFVFIQLPRYGFVSFLRSWIYSIEEVPTVDQGRKREFGQDISTQYAYSFKERKKDIFQTFSAQVANY